MNYGSDKYHDYDNYPTIPPEDMSEQDLEYAAEFRDGVHREALEIIHQTYPEISEVVDRWPVEYYFQYNWDYPGRWYLMIAIPKDSGGRKALVETIVRDTLAGYPEQHGQQV
ncbi:MAG: hypothetical protein IJM08_00850 [Firmicutes bacterium]|nr:hypothetical protein [Bacillota bacterium]